MTIMNMVQSMLKDKCLPNEIYDEDVSTATYILNRCLTKRLAGITPEERWFGVKPSLSHLKVPESIAHIHVPGQLRINFDDKSRQVILIGYHSTGGYKLFDNRNRRIVISREVVIDELEEWDWNNDAKNDSMRIMYEKLNYETEVGTNRSQRPRNLPAKLGECVVTSNDMINDEGELVHYAFYANIDPISVIEEFKDPK